MREAASQRVSVGHAGAQHARQRVGRADESGTTDRQEKPLKVALDELRMQMLGTQVLFGFLFSALFQERFIVTSPAHAIATSAGLLFVVGALAALITGRSLHRLALNGEASERMQRYASVCAEIALAALRSRWAPPPTWSASLTSEVRSLPARLWLCWLPAPSCGTASEESSNCV